MKFASKKPVIEAERTSLILFNAKNNWKDLPEWIKDSYEKGNIVFLPDSLLIKTSQGDHTAVYSSWIIKEINGEISVCRDDTFRESYCLVEKKT